VQNYQRASKTSPTYASTLPLHVFVKAYRRFTVILVGIGARLRIRFLGTQLVLSMSSMALE